MRSRHLIRTAALAGACLAGTAFAGLSLAASGAPHASPAATAASRHAGLLCVKYDGDDTQQCLPRGPRGRRGKPGPSGLIGPTGFVGSVGLTGPVGALGNRGPVGPQGPQGPQGIDGIQGIKGNSGPDGAFTTNPAGHTVVAIGTKIGPITFSNGPARGTQLTPSVAVCPTTPGEQEAYDGGAIITTAHGNQSGPTGDVVGLASSFPGIYNGPTEVDPLPLSATPGAVSNSAANAYEAQAVITNVHSGDNVTVQAYVVCGP